MLIAHSTVSGVETSSQPQICQYHYIRCVLISSLYLLYSLVQKTNLLQIFACQTET